MNQNESAYATAGADDFPFYECTTIGCPHEVSKGRWNIGYRTCLSCGEASARAKHHCIVPMHKSNYILVTPDAAGELLSGINSKTVR